MKKLRVSNIKPFIDKHNWKGTNYPSKIDDWKTFEKKIQQLPLIFCISKKKCSAYISKINLNCEN